MDSKSVGILFDLMVKVLIQKKHPLGQILKQGEKERKECNACIEFSNETIKKYDKYDQFVQYSQCLLRYGLCRTTALYDRDHFVILYGYHIAPLHMMRKEHTVLDMETENLNRILILTPLTFIGFDRKSNNLLYVDIESGDRYPYFCDIVHMLKTIITLYEHEILMWSEERRMPCITNFNIFTEIVWEINGWDYYAQYLKVHSYDEFIKKVIKFASKEKPGFEMIPYDELIEFSKSIMFDFMIKDELLDALLKQNVQLYSWWFNRILSSVISWIYYACDEEKRRFRRKYFKKILNKVSDKTTIEIILNNLK